MITLPIGGAVVLATPEGGDIEGGDTGAFTSGDAKGLGAAMASGPRHKP